MDKNNKDKANITPKGVIDLAKKQGAKMVDAKFVDTFGTWQHFSVPIAELTEDVFEEGFGFDGSSIRGWKSIEASDMLAMPDPRTAFIDPFCAVPTLSVTCTIAETGTKEAYNRDPRGIAQRGEKYLQSTGIADTAVFGPEAEFFIFDNVQFDSKSNGTFYEIDSEEAVWNTGRNGTPNLGYKIRHKEGYFPVAPTDTQQDIRTEMCLIMEQLGIKVERQHHEVATAGQAEIDFRFDTLVKTADTMMLYKYIIKNVAKRHGDRKSTRLNSSHLVSSYAVFCLKKKKRRAGKRAEQPQCIPRRGCRRSWRCRHHVLCSCPAHERAGGTSHTSHASDSGCSGLV